MAYMSQERKKGIFAELKKVIPKSWKWSLAVDHHSTIVLNIRSAPIDLPENYMKRVNEHRNHYRGGLGLVDKKPDYIQVNPYYLSEQFDGAVLKVLEKAKEALYRGNHDRSDIMTDYFDVGWYVSINIGRWNKPFVVA